MSNYFTNIFGERIENASNTTLFVLWAVILGLILAFFLVYFKRRVIGGFVRAILDAEAFDEATAKTPTELGQAGNESALAQLRKPTSSLLKVVTVVSDDAGDEPRVYIAEDKHPRARAQYGDGDKLWVVLLGSLGLIALGVLISILM